jgi:hypothetical protein
LLFILSTWQTSQRLRTTSLWDPTTSERRTRSLGEVCVCLPSLTQLAIYNPYSQSDVSRVWGDPKTAEKVGDYCARVPVVLENMSPDDRIIWIKPGETILGHTNEFIGGCRTVTTMMKARSSLGRNFIEVCKCAGWWVEFFPHSSLLQNLHLFGICIWKM